MTQTERPRHKVLRAGEREPIDTYKRRLIYERDGYHCQLCYIQVSPLSTAPGATLQLDHVIPWSALGSDRSDNLRSLCGPCNDDRSNFVDDMPPRLVGVVRACYWCAYRTGKFPVQFDPTAEVDMEQIKAYCGLCGTTSWVPAEDWIL